MMMLRYTKFPYVFWSSTKPLESKIDFTKKTICIKDDKGKLNDFTFRKMNFALFLIIKYSPLLLFIGLTFNRYDFSFEANKILSYAFSLMLLIPMLLENLARKILFYSFFIGILFGSFFLGDLSLAAFSLKYFIFLFCIFVFAVDLQYRPFEILKDERVIAHFLVKNNELNELEEVR